MEELLKDYPVVIECRVSWGDMDAFRHVNNVIYFRYAESARVTYGEKINTTEWLETEGLGPILKWTECRFIRPVAYPDTLSVGVRAMSVESGELKMGYKMVSEKQGAVVATAASIGVFYDYRNRRRLDEFPQPLIDRIEKLEGCPLPRKHES